MLIRVPDYYDRFRCLAGACPHSCCEKWEVVIDEEHARQYEHISGQLGERLRAQLRRDEDGDACFALNGGRCPFLDGDNLCQIHKQLGQEATSITCQEHPRFTEDYGPFREITLSASCPAANALLLGSEAPLTFRELETEEPEEEGDEWLTWLLPLRQRLVNVLTDRSVLFGVRLGRFLGLAAAVQECLDLGDTETLADIEVPDLPAPVLPEGAWDVLLELEDLEPDWPALLARAKAAPACPVSGALEERIAVYFAFRYLLKTVNDGDLLSRAQFVVFSVLAVEQLAAVCGPAKEGAGLAEALRRYSCEIEHCQENLDALMKAFWQREELRTEAFWT